MTGNGMTANRIPRSTAGSSEVEAIRVLDATAAISTESPTDRPPVELSALFHVLRRRWKSAVPLGLILAVACGYAGFKLLRPKYSASAFVRIDSEERPLVFQTADQAVSKLNFNLYKNTQKQLMTAPFVINAALRDKSVLSIPQVATQLDPIKWLAERLTVDFPGGGEIMQVTAEMDKESDSVAFVNAITNAYMNEVVVDERNKRLSRLDSLERVYAEAEGKVRTKQAELKKLADLLGTGDSDSLTVAQQNAIQQFGLMQERLADVQFKMMEAQGELVVAKKLEDQAGAQLRESLAAEQERRTALKEGTALVSKNTASSDRLRRMEDELILEQEHVRGLMRSYAISHPYVVEASRKLNSKRKVYEKQKKHEMKDSLEDQQRLAEQEIPEPIELQRMRESFQRAKSSVLGLETKVKILGTQAKVLQGKVDSLEEETRKLGRSSIDIELMRSEIGGLEEVLSRVGEEIERTSIELKTASRITLIGSAESATPPSNKKRIAVSAAMAGIGFCIPLTCLGVWDLTRRKVDDLKSVHATLPLANLGTIPLVSRRVLDNRAVSARSRRSREKACLTESIDSLAAMIRHRAESESRKVFLLTSAVEGEGKTTVACQVAQSLSRSGTSVLLMDFDCRRPSVHRNLQLDLAPGLREVLQGEIDWHDAIHKMDDLCVLTAGNSAAHLNEREVSGAVAELFFSVRRQFDLVLVDCCPVLPVADARVVGSYCDGAILTLIRDVSRLPAAASACEILDSHGVEIIGTVVIGASEKSYSYDSRYYDLESPHC